MLHLRSLASPLLVCTLAGVHPASAQSPRPYTLALKTESRQVFVTLKADNARVADIAADLGTRLHAKVVVGPGVQNERISVNLADTLLEPALISLAPRALVDYDVRQDTGPVPLGIYLLGANDPLPASDAVVHGTSQGVVIEGNTEDVPKSPQEDPLRVTGNRHFLTVVAKKQPLALVARAIGDVLAVPVDVKYDASELIDANLTNGLPEETVVGLSPNAHLYVRVDANLGERTPLKLVIERLSPK